MKLVKVGLLGLVGLSSVMAGCGGGSDDVSGVNNLAKCATNMQRLGTAMTMYTSDWDDHYPLLNRWSDATAPYAGSSTYYTCPGVLNISGFGYSFVATYVGKPTSFITTPDTTKLIFESNSLAWNSSQPLTNEIATSRHANYIVSVYADGHIGQTLAP